MNKFLAPLLLAVVAQAHAAGPAVIDGITFDDEKGKLYMPLREVAKAFGMTAKYASKTNSASLNGRAIKGVRIRQTYNGRALVPVSALPSVGISAVTDPKTRLVKLRSKKHPSKIVKVRAGQKRVFINKRTKQIAAWQGRRLVFRSIISIGSAAKQTPTGIFKAQGYKALVHRSRLYDNVPLPYAVQVVGNVFIHGFEQVGPGHFSHGCIRLPEKRAQWFYYWVQRGTPITILGKWPRGAVAKR